MKKPIEDIATLCFLPGSIRPLEDGKYNYISLLQKGLSNLGVTFPSAPDPAKTDIIPDISDFSSYSPSPATTYVVISDPDRGGQFYIYNGEDIVDEGMVFEDADGNKWKRVLTDNNLNIRWYGARAVSIGDPFDSLPAFLGVKDYIEAHPLASYVMYIPADSTGLSESLAAGRYHLSDTVEFNKSITIVGDGTIGYPASRLHWPLNKPGLIFRQIFGEEAQSVTLINLFLSADDDIPNYNLESHAITSTSKIQINNVECTNWGGDGLHLTSCASPPSGDNNNYGNGSKSVIENYRSTYCTNGIFVEGCDFNTSRFMGLDIAQQRRWGVYDNGFLGNNYYDMHFAFCGSPAINGSNSVVSYEGKCYSPLFGHDGYFTDTGDNIGILPTDTAYWYEVINMSAVVWNDSTQYFSGGTIAIRNANAWASVQAIYSECYQPSSQLNSRTKVDNDNDNCAGVRGIWHRLFEGSEIIYAPSGIIIPDNGVNPASFAIGPNVTDFSTRFVVENDAERSGNGSVARFKTKNGVSAVVSIETEDTSTFLWAQGGIMYWGISNSTRLAITEGVVYDPDNNGLTDLGAAANKFKKIYTTDARITGLSEYVDNAAALLAGKSAGDLYRTGDVLKIVH